MSTAPTTKTSTGFSPALAVSIVTTVLAATAAPLIAWVSFGTILAEEVWRRNG